MKIKIILLSAIVAMGIAFTSCANKPAKTTDDSTRTFEECLVKADSVVKGKFSAGETTLYEASTVLKRDSDGTITNVVDLTQTQVVYNFVPKITSPKESSTENHWETLIVTFGKDGTPIVTKYNEPWLEDVLITDSIMSLTQALDKLYSTDIIKPKTNNLILRQALYPGVTEPEYIFGTVRYFVSVGAKSGEVK